MATNTKPLTEKQKQLDVNGDGKIDADDLRRLRKGEKPDPKGAKVSANLSPFAINSRSKETAMFKTAKPRASTSLRAAVIAASNRLHASEGDAMETLAGPKSADAYEWFTYTGNGVKFTSKVGYEAVLKKNDQFGVRLSANKRFTRLVFGKLGPTKVFTIDPKAAQYLAKHCKPFDLKTRR